MIFLEFINPPIFILQDESASTRYPVSLRPEFARSHVYRKSRASFFAIPANTLNWIRANKLPPAKTRLRRPLSTQKQIGAIVPEQPYLHP